MTTILQKLGISHNDPVLPVVVSPSPTPAAITRSTVGALAMSLVASSQVKSKLIRGYVENIDKLAEELRQQRTAQQALTSGLKSLSDDPALTDEEQHAITTELQNHVEVEVDKAIAEALKAEAPVKPTPMPAAKPMVMDPPLPPTSQFAPAAVNPPGFTPANQPPTIPPIASQPTITEPLTVTPVSTSVPPVVSAGTVTPPTT